MLSLSTLQSFLDEVDDFDVRHTPLPKGHRPEQHAPSPLVKTRRKKRKQAGPAPLAPTNTKEGHSQRVTQLLRQIHALRQQLKHLHVDQRELLGPDAPQSELTRRNWKRQAILENCMKMQSTDENKLLKQRLRDNVAMAQTVRKLTAKQIDAVKQLQAMARPLSPMGVVLQDDDTLLFASIKSSMDACLSDLDSNMSTRLLGITQQCITNRTDANGQWRVTSSNQAVLLSFESSGLIPFNAETINAAICGQVRLDAPKQVRILVRSSSRHGSLLNAVSFLDCGQNIRQQHRVQPSGKCQAWGNRIGLSIGPPPSSNRLRRRTDVGERFNVADCSKCRWRAEASLCVRQWLVHRHRSSWPPTRHKHWPLPEGAANPVDGRRAVEAGGQAGGQHRSPESKVIRGPRANDGERSSGQDSTRQRQSVEE